MRMQTQTEHGRELRAERARSEQPDRDSQSGTWHRPHRLVRPHRPQQSLQFQDIVWEILGGHREIAATRARRALIGIASTKISCGDVMARIKGVK